MQTIKTEVLAATNTKPTRIRATHTGLRESITVEASRFDELEDAHKHAAALLMRKLKWNSNGRTMVGGGTNSGMVWVFEKDSPRINSWTLRKLELEETRIRTNKHFERDLTACGDNPHGG
jgi:hypothetical protein